MRKEAAAGENPGTVDLAEHLPYVIPRLAAALQTLFSAKIGSRGISQPQWRALVALWQTPSQSIGDLSAATGIEISTLSRTVAALAERGYIQRTRLASDARTVIAALTDSGLELTRSLMPAAAEIERAMLAGLDPQGEAALRSALAKILANLDRRDWNPTDEAALIDA